MANVIAGIGSKDDARGSILLRDVTVVDTRTGSLSPNMSIVLSGGRIQQILPSGQAPQGCGRRGPRSR